MTETNDKNSQDYRHHCYKCKKYRTKAKQKRKKTHPTSHEPYHISFIQLGKRNNFDFNCYFNGFTLGNVTRK